MLVRANKIEPPSGTDIHRVEGLIIQNERERQSDQCVAVDAGIANVVSPWHDRAAVRGYRVLGARWPWSCSRDRRRRWRRSRTWRPHSDAPRHVERVDAPTLIASTVVACHPPPKPARSLNRWNIHDCRDVRARVATPRLTTGNRTATIRGNCAVIPAHHKATAHGTD